MDMKDYVVLLVFRETVQTMETHVSVAFLGQTFPKAKLLSVSIVDVMVVPLVMFKKK